MRDLFIKTLKTLNLSFHGLELILLQSQSLVLLLKASDFRMLLRCEILHASQLLLRFCQGLLKGLSDRMGILAVSNECDVLELVVVSFYRNLRAD
jgi:hypothetical protein